MKIKLTDRRLLASFILAFCLISQQKLWAVESGAPSSTEAILQHPRFREGLVWIGQEPDAQESQRLLEILGDLDKPTWTSEVETFLNDYPTSPWAASLHHDYASFCQRTGRTTKALEHWQAAWTLVKDDTSEKGRRLGGAILANWMDQLSSLGRRDKLNELIAVGDQWPFGNRQDREKFQAAKNSYYLMGNHPEMSFRCGTLALKAIGQALQPTNNALENLVDIPSPTNGFSVEALAEMADKYHLGLTAMRRTNGQALIVPSIVHWRQNHYAAIIDRTNDYYLVSDPTFGKPKWMTAEVINEEASGVFLTPASVQKNGWTQLTPQEMASIHGMGLPCNGNDGKDKGCIPGTPCPPCKGMPVWWVSEPYINLWFADEPLSYLTSLGEPFTFRMSYKQRSMPTLSGPLVGTSGWDNSWYSYIHVEGGIPCSGSFCSSPAVPGSSTLHLPNGGEVDFNGLSYDPETQLQLLYVGVSSAFLQAGGDAGANGLRVVHADGSQDIYDIVVPYEVFSGETPETDYLRSRHVDPHGNTTWFTYYAYSDQYVLTSVVDYDGRTNTLTYTYNSHVGNLLTAVTNAYNQSAHFSYDTNGNLTNIIDAAGLPSSFTYDTNSNPTKLITPYGTNQFVLVENVVAGEGNIGGHNVVDRAAQVTDPTGSTQLYLFRYDSSQDTSCFLYTNFPSGDVPTGTPLATLDAGTGDSNSLSGVCFRNSYRWDARQYAALSTTNFYSFTANDYVRGRMRHWLQDTNQLSIYLSGQLSVERAPSPDGQGEGLKIFYDYQGKTHNYIAGTNPVPSVTAWRLPGGETHYEYVQFDYFGNITNRVATYTKSDGTTGTRTNQFVYANNIYTNVIGVLDGSGNIFDTVTNTFTVPDLLIKVIEANGSNSWTCGGFDPITWTNNFYILSGTNAIQTNQVLLSSLRVLPRFWTNGVNETTLLTFAGFNKATSIKRASGLTTTNVYDSNGFLVQTTDVEISRTNSFGYSTNGLPSTYTNELGLVMGLSWDNLLRLTGVSFPDTTTTSNVYNRLDLSARKDRLGNWTYFGHDGLRHLTSVTNANSNATYFGWCDCGALTSITDALTNMTTLNYDFQSRLTNIAYPDFASRNYQYDLAGRQTSIADGAGSPVNLTYNNQGLVTNVYDSYGSISHVLFDILDRPASITDKNNVTVTNTFDMLNRLVTRIWTADGIGEGFLYTSNGLAARTNRDSKVTYYGRDVAGRLTAITNANVPAQVTHLAYNAANQLTILVDGLGRTNTWNLNQFGWVTNKVDASNHQAFAYSHNANGWLTNRWMPASGNTQYKFDAIGNLTNIVYSNATTVSISYAFDAVNHITNMLDAVGSHSFVYTAMGDLASETGPWASDTVSYLYSQGQRTNLNLSEPSLPAWDEGYAYDGQWRMTGVTSPAGSFGYHYPASASALIQSLSLPNAALVTNQYDSLARLTNTALVNYWGHVLDGYSYGYDPLGLRTNIVRNLGLTVSTVTAAYDNIGQLTAWSAAESNGTLRFNEQDGYGFDAAGNLSSRTNGALVQTFTPDSLNQLATVTRTGTFTLSGVTPAPMTNVTVNGLVAQTNSDFTFARTNISLTNGANTFTVIAQNAYGVAATNILTVNLPATVTFQYDGNGNLTNDGTRNFIYDAENQATNINVAGQWKTEIVYDGLHRRRIERDYTWSGGAWLQTNETRSIYDRILPIQQRNSNNVPVVTYTRGVDRRHSLQRAGGIGGLLGRTDGNGSTYYHSDGNGNVTSLIDGNQNIAARYEFDGFGRLTGKWGALADANEMQFSSMPVQRQSGLVGFPFRPTYDPTLQRFLNRDPIQERGGLNLYRFALNNPVSDIDPLGFEGEDDYELERDLEEIREENTFGRQRELTAEEEAMVKLARDIAAAEAAAQAEEDVAKAAGEAAQRVRTAESDLSNENAPNAKVTLNCPPGTVVSRNWGGSSGPFGESWTTDPYTQQTRNSLGIGEWNTTEFHSFGEIIDSLGITTREAVAAEGYGGGGQETLIPLSVNQVRLNAVVMPDEPLPKGK